MAQLAIKGHATRGKEIIELLEMMGGKNSTKLVGSASSCGYYIDSIGNIAYHYYFSSYFNDAIQLTIEEFLEQYPYKIGDKVLREPYVGARRICEMRWDTDNNCIKYGIGVGEWFNVSQIQPYKEETEEENIIDTIKESADRYRIKVNYQFDIEVDEGEYYAVRRKPQYPKTYEECCKILNILSNGNIAYVGNWVYGGEYLEKHLDRLRNFQKLLICRDAYWKIAGEQIGLGKPWKPDFLNPTKEIRYFIFCTGFTIEKAQGMFSTNRILIFPTEEMRDFFYENFKDLIELCKELL